MSSWPFKNPFKTPNISLWPLTLFNATPITFTTPSLEVLYLHVLFPKLSQWCWTFLDFSTGLIPKMSHLLTWSLAKTLKSCSEMSLETQNRSQAQPRNGKTKWKIEKHSAPLKSCNEMSPKTQNRSQARPRNEKTKWKIEKHSAPMISYHLYNTLWNVDYCKNAFTVISWAKLTFKNSHWCDDTSRLKLQIKTFMIRYDAKSMYFKIFFLLTVHILNLMKSSTVLNYDVCKLKHSK